MTELQGRGKSMELQWTLCGQVPVGHPGVGGRWRYMSGTPTPSEGQSDYRMVSTRWYCFIPGFKVSKIRFDSSVKFTNSLNEQFSNSHSWLLMLGALRSTTTVFITCKEEMHACELCRDRRPWWQTGMEPLPGRLGPSSAQPALTVWPWAGCKLSEACM